MEPEDHDEGGMCDACAGSGEGSYDGSRCGTCRGSGEIRPAEDDDGPDYDDRDHDPKYDSPYYEGD